MKRKLNHGDIFSLEAAKGKYIFGRVLFNPKEQYLETPFYNESEIENYFESYCYCQLVEIYKGIYDSSEYKGNDEILIPRAFVQNIDDKYNKNIAWQKAGHKSVDPTKVEFPEVVGDTNDESWLYRGELMYPLYSVEDASDLPVSFILEPSIGDLTDACLFLQDRKDLINKMYPDEFMTRSYIDFLYHPELRAKFYKEIDRDPNKSYFELAKEEGFDLRRLY